MFRILHIAAVMLDGGLVGDAFFVLLQHIYMQENTERQDRVLQHRLVCVFSAPYIMRYQREGEIRFHAARSAPCDR